MRESEILYEREGHYAVKTGQCYTVFRHVGTHAVTDCAFALSADGLSLAQARIDYLAKHGTRTRPGFYAR